MSIGTFATGTAVAGNDYLLGAGNAGANNGFIRPGVGTLVPDTFGALVIDQIFTGAAGFVLTIADPTSILIQASFNEIFVVGRDDAVNVSFLSSAAVFNQTATISQWTWAAPGFAFVAGNDYDVRLV